MKKNVILILLLLVSVGLFGQYVYMFSSFEPEIIDGRAEALGLTSILSSSGANYVFNNPSMLSSLNSKDFQVNLRTHFGNTNKEKEHLDTDTNSIFYRSDTDYNRKFHTKFNGFSFGLPLNVIKNDDWHIGIAAGYRTYYDWGYDIHQKRKEEFDDEVEIEEEDSEYSGGFNTLVFGGGINFKRKFYGGLSISLPLNSEYLNEYETNDGNQATNEGTLKGSFFTFSGSYIMNQYVSFGLRIRTTFDLEIDGEDDYFNYQYSDKYTIPTEYAFALQISPIEKVRIFAEYLTRNLGDYYNIIYFNPKSDDGYSFRTGIEFGKKYKFRGGLFTQSVPVYEITSHYDELNDDYIVESKNKPQVETGITAGFGTNIFKKIQINFYSSYTFLNYDENYQNVEDTKVFNEISYSLIKIGCSFGYSF
ncbi:MAG: hypothetical protein KAS53_02770 [Candidatus Cloacimonetes bacterium]|nr:hypothetical protein [Candidatus Cloacimonadota bacterium]